MDAKRRDLLWYVFLFIPLTVGAIMAIFNYSYKIDDAYILLKYADNLVKFGEWTFNGIEKSNGSTSILYVLFLAVGGIFGQNIEFFSVILNTIIWSIWGGLTFYLLFSIMEKRWFAFFGTLFIITVPFFNSVYRMESHLVLVMQTASLIFFHQKKFHLMAGFLGLSVLARPDSFAYVAIIGLYFLIFRRKKTPWKALLTFGTVIAPWIIYSVINFGTIFPNTLSAKTGQTESGFWPTSFAKGLFEQIKNYHLQEPIALIFLSIMLILVIVALVKKIKIGQRKQEALLGQSLFKPVQVIILVYIIIYFLTYAFILGVPNYPWYYTTIIYYFLIIVISLVVHVEVFGKETISVMLVLLLIMLSQNSLVNLPLQLKPNGSGHVEDYKIIGEYLRENTPPGSTIGATEVGVLSWFSNRPVIDNLGLNNKELANNIRTRDVGSWLLKTEPDYILFNRPYWIWQRATPYTEWESVPWFNEAYSPIKTFSLVRGEYVLYNKKKSPRLAKDNQVDSSILAFPLDHIKDQYILGITESLKVKIIQAPIIEEITMQSAQNVTLTPSQATNTGTFENINGDPNLYLKLPQKENSSDKRYFLKITMKANSQPEHLGWDSVGQLFIATKNFPNYGDKPPIGVRVSLDNSFHKYYLPLFLDNKWLNLNEIIGLRFDPISDKGVFEIKSIELASLDT